MGLLTTLFEKFPEWPIKNSMRYFLAFNPMVPKAIQDLSPIKGYEMYRKLQEGDIVVDAGAFTGDYTIYAARKVGPNGLVIAFEPDEKNRAILQKNIEHDKLNNVIILPKGLWNENGTLSITSDGLHSMVGVPTQDYENNTADVGGNLTKKREYYFDFFTYKELKTKPMSFFEKMPLEIFILLLKQS
jgi:hypothetical protein